MDTTTTPPLPAAKRRVNLSNMLIGRPLETRTLAHQVVSNKVGLAVFASDALSSTAYATEEILVILALTGTAAFLGLSVPIAIAIAALLIIVTISYRQTIYAYPNGGGAYIVARDNLGEVAAQIAGAALLTDYILTVAVSISSGVAQIVSAFPDIAPWRVPLAVGIIGFITIINLRGVKESGSIFSVPTYFFLGMMFLTLGVGFYRWATGTLGVVTGVKFAAEAAAPLTMFLVLRAFSSGSAALTGIEAISNGITAFRDPRSRNAAKTLVVMSTLLVAMFLGITFLSRHIEAIPSHHETIISQLARTVYGDGSIFYLLLIAGTALILLMAANTSYADFPRLAALHAGDGFLPRQLTYRGGRLVFSWGIMTLAIAASVLVVVMRASTTALIPLYAIGVFLSFTISQAGMVVRLRKIGKLQPGEVVKGLETNLEYDPHWRLHMVVSGFGAVCTFVVMMIFAITKFTSGAWFILLLIPILVFIFFRIHHHYKDVAQALSLENAAVKEIVTDKVITMLLVDGVHKGTLQMVKFAKSLGAPWHAVHVGVNQEKAATTQAKWDRYVGEGNLVIIDSPYRHLLAPIREYVIDLLEENPGAIVHIVMGHLSMDSLFTQALHQNSSLILNLGLTGLERVVVTIVPLQVKQNGGEVNRNMMTGEMLKKAREERTGK
ncbi:Amino acid permease-associated region [Candidatus Promineifilum breve]|uniref:Amino acid permease-associated region n=1 Tax=Candidatus Promineifilum breve TaxID=1806508 RepID=A0A160T5A3_9CHLR|nr:APC family permease [Candidatus Promineifilum breve]CUS05541.1 Amino acid permease-associated region [Candidatus Promineifilum breve]